MKFSIETEINGSLSILDVKIFRENNKFVTSVLRKETFSRVYTNFISVVRLEHKFGLVHTLLNRCFNLFSDFLKFHHEANKFKNVNCVGNESNRYLLELNRVCLLKEICHHLIRTYTRRSYYGFEHSIWDNFFYLSLLQILF